MGEELPAPGLLQRPLQMGRIGRGAQQVHRSIRLLHVSRDITTAPLACFSKADLLHGVAQRPVHQHGGMPRVAAIPVSTVIGIDVGGSRKGFHAVAVTGGAYAGQLATPDVQELGHWCRSVIGAQQIAIDAPCRWSGNGRARPCERELMQQGIFCFASPAARWL